MRQRQHGGGGWRGDALFKNFDIIKWMEYRTVFDIVQAGYKSWPIVLIGVALTNQLPPVKLGV